MLPFSSKLFKHWNIQQQLSLELYMGFPIAVFVSVFPVPVTQIPFSQSNANPSSHFTPSGSPLREALL
jgi:hypothetical protein